MKLLLLLSVLVSCSEYKSQKDELHEKALLKSCTTEELKLVEKDFILCAISTYFTSHCYDIAKVSYCSNRIEKH